MSHALEMGGCWLRLACGLCQLPQGPAITIAPPLRGGRYWLVSEGSGNSHSHHWGSLLALNGVVTTPQRYAVDYVGLNGRGHALEVAPDKLRDSANTDWFGYESDVLAVAGGVVRDVRDGQPDGKPMSKHGDESDLTARGLYGNFVVLEIAPPSSLITHTFVLAACAYTQVSMSLVEKCWHILATVEIRLRHTSTST